MKRRAKNIIGISLIGTIIFLVIVLIFVWLIPKDEFGASITTIAGSDKIKDSRTVINDNFSALNNNKMEMSTTSVDSITTLSNLTTIGTLSSFTTSGLGTFGTFISQGSSTIESLHVQKLLTASSTLTIDGLTILNGGLTLETGDTFTFNGDAFTSFTSDGTLSIISNALRVVDVICTNCLNATEIEDIYLLDDGDIGTGVYDFGGTTSFEITNGTNPTVDIAGKIAIDTTTGQLIFHDGVVKQVLSATSTKSFTITSPDGLAQKEYDLWHLPYAITITDISCNVDAKDQLGSGNDQPESIVLNPYERDGLTAIATTTIDGNFICDNRGTSDDDVFSNASLDAGDLFGVFVGTASGTPEYVQMSIDYVITAD